MTPAEPESSGGQPLDPFRNWLSPMARPMAYGFAVLTVVVCTAIGMPLRGITDADNLAMVYLTGVVIAAARFGVGPSILASVLSVTAFNFFFTQPYYSLQVYDTHYYVTLAVMLLTSLLVGSMTAQVARHAQRAEQKEHETLILYALARDLSSVRDRDAMITAVTAAISAPYRVNVRVLAAPSEVSQDNSALYLPLLTEGENLGVMVLTPDEASRNFTPAERLQFETFATLTASALQRARLGVEAETVRVESENEKLRNILLSSVSHDLRTPLTVMNGSLGTLLKMRKKLPREAMDELTGLWGQLVRLQKFVGNLLRLAALTSGQMKLNLQPYLIQEIIGAALGQVEAVKAGRSFRTVMTGALPMVLIDGALTEQVLVNLLENAIRHTASDGVITVSAVQGGDFVRVEVSDNGEGFPDGADTYLFEPYETTRTDRGNGAGLGLAICRGVVQAQGGTIQAGNVVVDIGQVTGARFTFTLPVLTPESA